MAVVYGWCAVHYPGRGRWANTPSGMAPGWAKLRQKVLQRDHGACVLCGRPATDVDHIKPRSEGGRDEVANLRSLCHDCHATRTGGHAGQASAERHRQS